MKRRQKEIRSRNAGVRRDADVESSVSRQRDKDRIKNIIINEEPTHMSWDEVRKEAEKLGIPLKHQPSRDACLHQPADQTDNNFEASLPQDLADTAVESQLKYGSKTTKVIPDDSEGLKKEGQKKQLRRDAGMSKSVASLKQRHEKLLTGGITFYSDSDDYYQNAPRVVPPDEHEKRVRDRCLKTERTGKWVEEEGSGVERRPPVFLKNILKLRNFFKRLDSRYSKKQCDCDEKWRGVDRLEEERRREKVDGKECQRCRRLCKYCCEEYEGQMGMVNERGHMVLVPEAIPSNIPRVVAKGASGDVAAGREKKTQLGSVFSVRSVQSECSFCRTAQPFTAQPEHHSKYPQQELSCQPPQQHKRHPPLFVKLPKQRLQGQIEEQPQQHSHLQQQQQQHDQLDHQKSSSLNRNLQRSTRFDSCLSFSSSSEHNSLERHHSKMLSSSGYTALEVLDFQIFASTLFPQLKNILWYWGSLDREGAVRLLSDKREGTYLIRDSSDDRYVLAISFKSQADIHHTGIEYFEGKFSFHEPSPPILQAGEASNADVIAPSQATDASNNTNNSTNNNTENGTKPETTNNDNSSRDVKNQNNISNNNNIHPKGATNGKKETLTRTKDTEESIVEFIEMASRNAMIEADKYFLQPRKNDSTAVPLKLWWPLLRPLETLKNLTSDVVIGAIGSPDFIKVLPISLDVKKIIKNRFKAKKC